MPMSTLVFDSTAHTLTLLDAQGQQVGYWDANNTVDGGATLRFLPNPASTVIGPAHPRSHARAAPSTELAPLSRRESEGPGR